MSGQTNKPTDLAVATEFLVTAKSGIKAYAQAITETATPEVKNALRDQLMRAIQTHEQISSYMISHGYYHPHDVQEQIRLDLSASQAAINMTQS
ncbi:spore coat protein [Bacillus canaveralius]|uniref:Spore coat protein n=1 Tax=Bacillus canaveralius TaxID=1403243 RepID=A0A2N5GHR5_9BACI|nr:spore coat protein [Bacillus canaveralius]PLR80297.1 spore coat protein [Bacillus canaveralius]PLR95484.1 spore coat protein [Bacillus canaveralius]RSK53920.1 spore coat protein [Bacillus canaveralius]